jgi:uncharacterized membrane protein
MEFETSKTLGAIGAILVFITPFVGAYTGILGLIGLILVLISMKGLADHYGEQGIFNNALYGVIIAIVGIVIFFGIVVFAAFELLTALGIPPASWTDIAILQQIDWSALIDFSMFTDFIVTIVASIVVLFVFAILTAIFVRKSLSLVSAKSGVGLFGTTGLLILIGAVLTIIAIGLILIWISMLLLAVAFFSLKATARQPAEMVPPQPSQ